MRSLDELKRTVAPFRVESDFDPSGDQPAAIAELTKRIESGEQDVVIGNTVAGRPPELPGADVIVHVEPRAAEGDLREQATVAALSVPDVREVHNVRVMQVDGGYGLYRINLLTGKAESMGTLTDQIILKRVQNVRGVGRATIAGGVARRAQVESADPMVAYAPRYGEQEIPHGSVRRRMALHKPASPRAHRTRTP